jgi:hypothetical protein
LQCLDGKKKCSSDNKDICQKAGGTTTTASCCKSTQDFPNTCLRGPCGCSPENSHDVKVCQCPSGKCFDGTNCVVPPQPDICQKAGGTTTTASCCKSTQDFPNTCLRGPCGCSPANSHDVKVCQCSSDKCFDGTNCVKR